METESISQGVAGERVVPVEGCIRNLDPLLHRLRNGGVAILPTDTLYALSARIGDERALERLFRLKGRSVDHQVPLFVDGVEGVRELTEDLSPVAIELMRNFWPGPLTLVLRAQEGISRFLTGKSRTIGVRQPAHALIRCILAALGEPITGTSANLSGAMGPRRLDQISPDLMHRVDMVVDGGELSGQKGSTVLDLSREEIKILRQGDLSLARIREVIDL